MPKKRDTRVENLGVEARKSNWAYLIQMLIVGMLSGTISIGGISFISPTQKNNENFKNYPTMDEWNLVNSHLISTTSKLNEHIDRAKQIDDLNEKRINIQVESIKESIKLIRDDQKELNRLFKKLLEEISRK